MKMEDTGLDSENYKEGLNVAEECKNQLTYRCAKETLKY